MKMIKVYPTWDEVKEDATYEDLYLFVDYAREGKDIDDAINEWIEENYEYTLEPDEDAIYDEWIEEQMMDDSDYISYDDFAKEKIK